MPWASIDDHFPESESALTAGVEACGLHLLATVWCAGNMTDGELPVVAARRLLSGCRDDGGDKLIPRLIEVGLWKQRDDGSYLLTDFLTNNNRTRKQIEKDLEAKRRAGSKGGRSKAEKDRNARRAASAENGSEWVSDEPLEAVEDLRDIF